MDMTTCTDGASAHTGRHCRHWQPFLRSCADRCQQVSLSAASWHSTPADRNLYTPTSTANAGWQLARCLLRWQRGLAACLRPRPYDRAPDSVIGRGRAAAANCHAIMYTHVADCALRASGCGLRATHLHLSTARYTLRAPTVNCLLATSGSRLCTINFHLRFVDCVLRVANMWLYWLTPEIDN